MKGFALLVIIAGIFSGANATHYYIPNGDVASLKAAIDASNINNAADTIHLFPYSTYKLITIDNMFIFSANALPRIKLDNGNYANSLTILGNGARLVLDTSAVDEVRIMYLEDGKIKIYDLAFINGSGEYDDDQGGAIYYAGGSFSSQLDLYGCLFKDNSAFQGGAIYVVGGNLNVENCTFMQNDAMFMGSAICNLSANVFIRSSVLVDNICTNTSVPGALYNYIALNLPAVSSISLFGSIVARNTYQNVSSPNHGKEYDLAQNSGIYTAGNNFIGSYDNSSPGNPMPFFPCLPCSTGDYVGSSAAVIDPMLGTFARHGEYQPTYTLLPGSMAILSHSGPFSNTHPAIASYGLFPTSGKEADEITIYGKNLSTIFKVDFEGASITDGITVSDTSVTVTVPPGATTGKITVYDYNLFPATSRQVFTINTDPDEPDPVTAIEEETVTAEFSFYPNPVSTVLFVKTGGKTFSISDLMGRELLFSNLETVDVRDFKQGMYLIRCETRAGRFVKD